MATAMPHARTISEREAVTEETWLLDLRWEEVSRLDLDAIVVRYPRIVTIAPHPGDEVLSVGATLADIAGRGTEVTVIVATHGDDGLGAAVRRVDGDRAISALSPTIRTVWWDLPYGRLADVNGELRRLLSAEADTGTLLLAPVESDGSTDHDAVARAAEEAALERGAALLQYPVPLWHWAQPDDADWRRLRTLAPPLRALERKSDAAEHLGNQLGSAALARARRVVEVVLAPNDSDLAGRVADIAAPRTDVSEPFDAMFSEGRDDPWHFDDSVYETRRHDLVMACLGRQRYSRVIDIGCATGQLAARLAARADAVTGIDASAPALAVAAARTPDVRWLRGTVPADLPRETFDLIVLSEVTYFLDGPDLLSTLRRVRQALAPDGEIVLANWRRPTDDIPLDGPTTHRQAAAVLDLPVRARYEDADLLIEVWGHPLSVYDDGKGES
ncbi:SAM-dependent methyltransferase [Mycobacterium sp. 236(2023)]|uniref:SAM-dependent methyltransferase n=1 Tax=Mycobacterium sp. 236(2023) TaxID=3038163 RepID=UPI0024156242|nr:SAM-dependent methyltransferase [Mycobacterium sp. 236(2023)]MDG4664850.1 SAM-dependent methyltransferase [Mycobacterium sp. 236(2023)]